MGDRNSTACTLRVCWPAIIAPKKPVPAPNPALATSIVAPAVANAGIVQQTGYRHYRGYRNYGYRNYGYRNYGYGYRRYGYGGYGYRPYGYYGGYGYPYWRPGISLWFGF